MSEIKNKKDLKVEILRIIACLAVIWYHIRMLPWKSDGELSETAVFFESVCTICVMTFFLISGFFIYNKKGNIIKDWLNLILNFIKTIFIPFLIVVVFCIIFQNFMISTDTFIGCIQKFSLQKIFQVLYDAFSHYNADFLPGTAGHLWYVFSYMLIILTYPLTRLFLTKLPRKVVYLVLIFFTINMILNDYWLFYGSPRFDRLFQIVHKPIYYSAWGSVLNNDIIKKYLFNTGSKKIIINKTIAIASVIIYFIVFVLLFKTQCAYDLATKTFSNGFYTSGPYVYTSWLSTYSLVMTTAFVLFVYNINFDILLNEKIKNIIYFISKRTFGVFLIHYLYVTKFVSRGVQSIWSNFSNIFQYLLYFIIYGAIIFILSFATVLLLEFIFIRRFNYGKAKRLS